MENPIAISIIIPTLNRAGTLRLTLASISNLQVLNGLEVLVIDNGSTDNTFDIYDEFKKINKFPLSYYNDAEPGLLTGRHLGASLAKGDILCFLDDDVELSPNWLQGINEAFCDPTVQIATGPSVPKFQSDPPDWLRYFWTATTTGAYCHWLSLIDLGYKKMFIDPSFAFGLNFCIRKGALISLGGFHPDNVPPELQIFQGDGETGLTRKAHKLNYKCFYHPSIKVFHIISSERLTVQYFKKRAFYEGVCKSFSELKKNPVVFNKQRTLLKKSMKTYLALLKQAIYTLRENTPPEIEKLRKLYEAEELRGYEFHQHAYRTNKKVKEWVHKKDYWDYRLPITSTY